MEYSLLKQRNLITNSANLHLSYEYINDCLRAGLVYENFTRTQIGSRKLFDV